MRKMGIGLGVGINRSNYAQGIFNAYSARVVADGGVVESGSCVDAVSSLLQSASLLLIPSGYKANKLYSEIPTNGNGDLTWTRASTALRTNSSSLLESMGTGVPRLSYMYGSCPALLLEPQRTNAALYSEQFDNLYWQGGGIMTSVTANTTTAPNGTTTADTAVVNATYNNASRAIVAGITNGTIYTLSVYVKKSASGGASNVRLSVNNTLSWTGASTQKVALTNDWQRVTLTWTSNSSVQAYFIIGSVDNTGASDSTCYGNIDIWGAQMEVGSYPTTYIPTTSATATRVADSFSRNNIYTNGLISASGGTWFVELRNNVAMVGDAGGDAIVLGDIASTAGNNFRLYNPPSSSRMQIFKTVSSGATPIYTTTTDTVKIAIKWNGTTADVFANGTKVVSATAFTSTAMEYFWTNITGVPKFIQQMALFNSPLTDAQCQTLTT